MEKFLLNTSILINLKNSFKDRHINIEGVKILEEIIKKKKSVIFVSGHFANFELMSMELVKKN